MNTNTLPISTVSFVVMTAVWMVSFIGKSLIIRPSQEVMRRIIGFRNSTPLFERITRFRNLDQLGLFTTIVLSYFAVPFSYNLALLSMSTYSITLAIFSFLHITLISLNVRCYKGLFRKWVRYISLMSIYHLLILSAITGYYSRPVLIEGKGKKPIWKVQSADIVHFKLQDVQSSVERSFDLKFTTHFCMYETIHSLIVNGRLIVRNIPEGINNYDVPIPYFQCVDFMNRHKIPYLNVNYINGKMNVYTQSFDKGVEPLVVIFERPFEEYPKEYLTATIAGKGYRGWGNTKGHIGFLNNYMSKRITPDKMTYLEAIDDSQDSSGFTIVQEDNDIPIRIDNAEPSSSSGATPTNPIINVMEPYAQTSVIYFVPSHLVTTPVINPYNEELNDRRVPPGQANQIMEWPIEMSFFDEETAIIPPQPPTLPLQKDKGPMNLNDLGVHVPHFPVPNSGNTILDQSGNVTTNPYANVPNQLPDVPPILPILYEPIGPPTQPSIPMPIFKKTVAINSKSIAVLSSSSSSGLTPVTIKSKLHSINSSSSAIATLYNHNTDPYIIAIQSQSKETISHYGDALQVVNVIRRRRIYYEYEGNILNRPDYVNNGLYETPSGVASFSTDQHKYSDVYSFLGIKTSFDVRPFRHFLNPFGLNIPERFSVGFQKPWRSKLNVNAIIYKNCGPTNAKTAWDVWNNFSGNNDRMPLLIDWDYFYMNANTLDHFPFPETNSEDSKYYYGWKLANVQSHVVCEIVQDGTVVNYVILNTRIKRMWMPTCQEIKTKVATPANIGNLLHIHNHPVLRNGAWTDSFHYCATFCNGGNNTNYAPNSGIGLSFLEAKNAILTIRGLSEETRTERCKEVIFRATTCTMNMIEMEIYSIGLLQMVTDLTYFHDDRVRVTKATYNKSKSRPRVIAQDLYYDPLIAGRLDETSDVWENVLAYLFGDNHTERKRFVFGNFGKNEVNNYININRRTRYYALSHPCTLSHLMQRSFRTITWFTREFCDYLALEITDRYSAVIAIDDYRRQFLNHFIELFQRCHDSWEDESFYILRHTVQVEESLAEEELRKHRHYCQIEDKLERRILCRPWVKQPYLEGRKSRGAGLVFQVRSQRRCKNCLGYAPLKYKWIAGYCEPCHAKMVDPSLDPLMYEASHNNYWSHQGKTTILKAPVLIEPCRPNFKAKPLRDNYIRDVDTKGGVSSFCKKGGFYGNTAPSQMIGFSVNTRLRTLAVNDILDQQKTTEVRLFAKPLTDPIAGRFDMLLRFCIKYDLLGKKDIYKKYYPFQTGDYEEGGAVYKDLRSLGYPHGKALSMLHMIETNAKFLERSVWRTNGEEAHKEGWINSFEPRKRKLYYEAIAEYKQSNKTRIPFSFFVKRELDYHGSDRRGIRPAANPRIICNPAPISQVIMGPVLRSATSLLHDVLSPENTGTYFGGLRPNQANMWINRLVSKEYKFTNYKTGTFESNFAAIENDFSKFDCTYSRPCFDFILGVYTHWGLPTQSALFKDVFKAWMQPIGMFRSGLKIRAPIMNASGRADTALMNALVNYAVQYAAFIECTYNKPLDDITREEKESFDSYFKIGVLGDDSITFTRHFDDMEDLVADKIAEFGFEARSMKVHRAPQFITFLGNRIYPTRTSDSCMYAVVVPHDIDMNLIFDKIPYGGFNAEEFVRSKRDKELVKILKSKKSDLKDSVWKIYKDLDVRLTNNAHRFVFLRGMPKALGIKSKFDDVFVLKPPQFRTNMNAIEKYEFESIDFTRTIDKTTLLDICLDTSTWREGVSWGPSIGRRVSKLGTSVEVQQDPLSWLKGNNEAALISYPFVPILSDLARRTLEILDHIETNKTLDLLQDFVRYKALSSNLGCIVPSERMGTFLKEVYGLRSIDLEELNMEISKTRSLPAIITIPWLDKIVTEDTSG